MKTKIEAKRMPKALCTHCGNVIGEDSPRHVTEFKSIFFFCREDCVNNFTKGPQWKDTDFIMSDLNSVDVLNMPVEEQWPLFWAARRADLRHIHLFLKEANKKRNAKDGLEDLISDFLEKFELLIK